MTVSRTCIVVLVCEPMYTSPIVTPYFVPVYVTLSPCIRAAPIKVTGPQCTSDLSFHISFLTKCITAALATPQHYNIIPCTFDVAVVIKVYYCLWGGGGGTLPFPFIIISESLMTVMSCVCNGSKFHEQKTPASLTVQVSIGICSSLWLDHGRKAMPP